MEEGSVTDIQNKIKHFLRSFIIKSAFFDRTLGLEVQFHRFCSRISTTPDFRYPFGSANFGLI